MAKNSNSNSNSNSKKRSHSTADPTAAVPKPTVFRKTKKAKQQHESSTSTSSANNSNKSKGNSKSTNPGNGPKVGDVGSRKPGYASNSSNSKNKVKSTSNSNSTEQLKPKPKPKPQKKKQAKPLAPPPPPTILPVAPPASSSFRIIVGSYQRLLYGLQVEFNNNSNSKLQATLKPIFTFPAHASSIKSVACAGSAPVPLGIKDGMQSKWLATGGTDESIKVWDLRKRIEVGQLTGHEGEFETVGVGEEDREKIGEGE